MKHIVMSNGWVWGTEPVPGYRLDSRFGRLQRTRAFLPVRGLTPSPRFVVSADYGRTQLYAGLDRAAAEAAKAAYDAAQADAWRGRLASPPVATLAVGPLTLPTDNFQVLSAEGTVIVAAGHDDSARCLLFVGCRGTFRDDAALLQSGTTGTVIMQASAGNACGGSGVEVMVILATGESVAFHAWGRRTDEVYVYTFDGAEVDKVRFTSLMEWTRIGRPHRRRRLGGVVGPLREWQ